MDKITSRITTTKRSRATAHYSKVQPFRGNPKTLQKLQSGGTKSIHRRVLRIVGDSSKRYGQRFLGEQGEHKQRLQVIGDGASESTIMDKIVGPTHYSSRLVLELGAGFVDDERAIVAELLEQSEEGDFVGVETWERVFGSNVFDQKRS